MLLREAQLVEFTAGDSRREMATRIPAHRDHDAVFTADQPHRWVMLAGLFVRGVDRVHRAVWVVLTDRGQDLVPDDNTGELAAA